MPGWGLVDLSPLQKKGILYLDGGPGLRFVLSLVTIIVDKGNLTVLLKNIKTSKIYLTVTKGHLTTTKEEEIAGTGKGEGRVADVMAANRRVLKDRSYKLEDQRFPTGRDP